MNLIENLEWRYATKKYDASKKVSTENIDKVKRAIQLSPSSYGLQLFKVLIIEDKSLREKLQPVTWGQPQTTDASHLMVFCNYAEIKDEHVDEYINLKAETQGLDASTLAGYGDFMKMKLKEKGQENLKNWTAKQTYIALANALNACAELKIDSTPMEGFEKDQYDKILGLKKLGLETSVILAIGYRSEEDETPNAKKVRKSTEALFEVR